MGFKRKHRILSSGKSPSFMAMNRTRLRAILGGGVTQDFTNNIENLREIMRKLSYTNGQTFFQDCPFVYVPSSYGESKNFAQVQNKRNLLLWSEEFNNVFWFKDQTTVTANTVNAPNGTNTADSLFETTSNTSHSIYDSAIVNVVSGTTYTYSFYVKANGRTIVSTNFNSAYFGSNNTFFDLSTGLITSQTGVNSPTITPLPDGWYRVSITKIATANSSGISNVCLLRTVLTGTTTTYVGDITKGLYIWGAQLEIGAYATPYQKTVASGDGIVDFNFTRATFSSNTNKLGVIEDSCYNRFQRSDEFDNPFWVKNNVSIAQNTDQGPFFTGSADRLVEDNTNNAHYITFNGIGTNVIHGGAGMYTMSFYAKANTRSWCRIFIYDGTTTRNVYFNLASGTLGTVSSGSVGSITPAGNGYYLCSHTLSSTYVAVNGPNGGIVLATADNVGSYLGDGVSSIYIWGAQLVQGSTPRPYLRTTNRLNVPKLDYSRSLLEPSLLIERQATNLLVQSENLAVSWNQNASTVSINTNLNPFGVNKSYYLLENNTTATHSISGASTFSVTSGLTYSSSFYIKKAQDTWVQLSNSILAFPNNWVNFNFDTGLFGNNGGNGSWTSKQLTNGYWLITITGVSTASGGYQPIYVIGTNNTNSGKTPSYLGVTGHQICDIAAMQFELSSTATSYIPTTTAAVTRNADNQYTDLFNNAALNRTNFTLFWEGYLYNGQTTNMSVCLSDSTTAATNTNQIGFFDGIQPFYNIANTRTNSGLSGANNALYKFAIRYNNGTVDFYRNGVNIWTQSVAVFDYRYLVLNSGNSTFATDKLMIFNRTLTSGECITLTT